MMVDCVVMVESIDILCSDVSPRWEIWLLEYSRKAGITSCMLINKTFKNNDEGNFVPCTENVSYVVIRRVIGDHIKASSH